MRPLPKRSFATEPEQRVVEITPGMDTQPPADGRWRLARPVYLGVLMLLIAASGGYWAYQTQSLTRLDPERIQIGLVTEAPFQEFVPVNAQLIPDEIVFLDTVEGGLVSALLVEEGADVEKGAPLVTLQNTELELQVMSREVQYTEQLSNLARAEISFDQTRLGYDRDLMDAQLRIDQTRTSLQQRLPIEETGFAQAEIDRLEAELAHQESTYTLLLEARNRDQSNAERNLGQLRDAVDRLGDSLGLLRATLDGLTLKAPIDGRVSSLNIRLGEVVPRGGRLGQVDAAEGFKARALVDEFYLGQVTPGQTAKAEIGARAVLLSVDKVFPEITNRQFQVELSFNSAMPEGLRRGQALRTRLSLSGEENILTVPNGPWYEATGGLWAFVLVGDGTAAERRGITLGRRTPEAIEVLSGLRDGDRILTTNYDGFTDEGELRLAP